MQTETLILNDTFIKDQLAALKTQITESTKKAKKRGIRIEPNKLPDLLNKILETPGWRFDELISKTNIDRNTLNNWLTGFTRTPHMVSLEPIRKLLGVSTSTWQDYFSGKIPLETLWRRLREEEGGTKKVTLQSIYEDFLTLKVAERIDLVTRLQTINNDVFLKTLAEKSVNQKSLVRLNSFERTRLKELLLISCAYKGIYDPLILISQGVDPDLLYAILECREIEKPEQDYQTLLPHLFEIESWLNDRPIPKEESPTTVEELRNNLNK